MATFRKNDPAGVCNNPQYVIDPIKDAELRAELSKKIQYVRSHYATGRDIWSLHEGYNSSVPLLKKIAAGKISMDELGRLDLRVQLAITVKAREFAEERGIGEDHPVSASDRQRALEWAASTLKPIRGRPAAKFLERVVVGLMALVQSYTGKPVLVGKSRNDSNEIHLRPGVSQSLLHLLHDVDPSITETQVANIVARTRPKYAGREMRFETFFPGYSAGPLKIVFHTADGGRVDGGLVRSI